MDKKTVAADAAFRLEADTVGKDQIIFFPQDAHAMPLLLLAFLVAADGIKSAGCPYPNCTGDQTSSCPLWPVGGRLITQERIVLPSAKRRARAKDGNLPVERTSYELATV